MKFAKWQSYLNVSIDDSFDLHTELDLPDQDIIKSDVERAQSGNLTESEREILELFLTKYCKIERINYKQCMNEICAPFVLMTRYGLSTQLAYLYFKGFIEVTMPTMFSDPEFRPLQACFIVFRLILRYHEPRLSAFFELNKITPELYTTSWFLTAFGFKTDGLSLLYDLWYNIILEQDQLFLVFIAIGLVKHFINDIINKEDCLIAHAISQLSIKTKEDLKSILKIARKSKKNTPYSTIIRLMQYKIFNLEAIDITLKELEKEYCLLLPPQEILSRVYPGEKVCDCIHVKCMWCGSNQKKLTLYIIDCRIEKEQSFGKFPNTYYLPGESYKSHQLVLEYPDRFLEVRGRVHICLMGSSAFKSTSFNITQSTKSSENSGQQMVETLLKTFLIKGFPYISLADGGFEQCHEFVDYLGLQILDHNPKKCLVCSKGRPSYSNMLKTKFKQMQQSFMGTIKENVEEKKRSKSQDQDAVAPDLTVSKMVKNTKTQAYKCRIFEKKSSNTSEQKFIVMFNDTSFAVGKACPGEKFPVSLEYRYDLLNLLKITSLRDHPSVLNFFFVGHDQVLTYKFKTNDIARMIINQIKKFYAAIKSSKN